MIAAMGDDVVDAVAGLPHLAHHGLERRKVRRALSQRLS